MDYSSVVVHIFTEEGQEFYGLERLWSDQHLDIPALLGVQRLDGNGGHFLFAQHIILSFYRSGSVHSAPSKVVI